MVIYLDSGRIDNGVGARRPAENDVMDCPRRFPAEMSAGAVSVCRYDPADAAELFRALEDERAWQHVP